MKNSIITVSLSALMVTTTSFTQTKDLQRNKAESCEDYYVIDKVPAFIDKPGKWCVKKNLKFTGTGNAITVTANNVTLNFGDHNL